MAVFSEFCCKLAGKARQMLVLQTTAEHNVSEKVDK